MAQVRFGSWVDGALVRTLSGLMRSRKSYPHSIISSARWRGSGVRGRNAASLAWRPVLADRCRSRWGCRPTRRVPLRGYPSAQRLRARSGRYGSCGYRYVLRGPDRDAPSFESRTCDVSVDHRLSSVCPYSAEGKTIRLIFIRLYCNLATGGRASLYLIASPTRG
jgi:hypothetical protein